MHDQLFRIQFFWLNPSWSTKYFFFFFSFSGLPTFLEAFTPLGVKIQRKIHPQVPMSGMWIEGDAVLFVHLHLACFKNHLQPCCLWHFSPFQAHDGFFTTPRGPTYLAIRTASHQAAMNSDHVRRIPSDTLPPPHFPAPECLLFHTWLENCVISVRWEMWPGSAQECLWQSIALLPRTPQWGLCLATRNANKEINRRK